MLSTRTSQRCACVEEICLLLFESHFDTRAFLDDMRQAKHTTYVCYLSDCLSFLPHSLCMNVLLIYVVVVAVIVSVLKYLLLFYLSYSFTSCFVVCVVNSFIHSAFSSFCLCTHIRFTFNSFYH